LYYSLRVELLIFPVPTARLHGSVVFTYERMVPALVDASLVIYLLFSRKFLASKHRLSSMFGYFDLGPILSLQPILSSKLLRS